ncbi:MAG: acetyl-CoA C-acyltransferase [Rhodospirillaceae bacterium]|uniref:beta-ketothiolase BktB n=1 Tax=Hwanghaeella sp. 1Z406 TaxID=3402811 RepID=UPI000C568CD8|nr:acetyl-CoA C-acyltransferase [Rhodospirillales bacterium]MAX49049.1 acetyl-CoA C-acyltransferase [Rhodospirillaceae bacterium]
MAESVVILSGARTAIGSFDGSLSSIPPIELGAAAAKAAIDRSGVDAEEIDQAVFGNIIHTEPRDMYLSRAVSIAAGVKLDTPALTLNRLCGSGLQAIISGAQSIMLGDASTMLVGGAESMSRSPHATRSIRTGHKMGDLAFTDMLIGVLSDPFDGAHMGVTAENVAKDKGINRETQDKIAVESHRRAINAIDKGFFKDQIIPIEVKSRRETVSFDTDEHPRRDATLDGMASLRPVFQKDGSVTAGNASGINDGAAALVLMSETAAQKAGRTPLARIVGYAHAGVDPTRMGIGPVPAVRRLLERTGLKIEDFDVIESNEAFAAQACAVANELGFDPEKLNPNGGAIALGHPVGATGAILTVKTVYELRRTGKKLGLITMCIGGGQGIAMAVESLA